NGKILPFLADHIGPGETFAINLSVTNFTSSTFPVRVRAYGFSVVDFIRQQANVVENLRRTLINNTTAIDHVVGLKDLAADSLAFRDSVFTVYYKAGLFTPQEVSSLTIPPCQGCTGEEVGASAPPVTNGFNFSPGGSPGTANYGNVIFDPGQDYLWEINEYNGIAGGNPGWDLR